MPQKYVGAVIQLLLANEVCKNISYVDDLTVINFEAPLANLLTDFYDQLKTVTSGYGTFNYELAEYRARRFALTFLLWGDMAEALSRYRASIQRALARDSWAPKMLSATAV